MELAAEIPRWLARRRYAELARPVAVATAALLFTAAGPPHDWWPVAWLVPGLLLVASAGASPLRAAVHGLAFGTIWGCTMAGWMFGASVAYFSFDRLGAAAFVVAVSLFYAGIPNALLTAAYAALRPFTPPAWRGLAGAWLWTASEILRASIFTGLPWVLLGHTQHEQLLLIQIAELGGAYAVSFLVALISVTAAELALAAAREELTRGIALRRLGACAVILLAVLGHGLSSRTKWAQPPPESGPTFAVVQGNVPNSLRWKREFFERNLLSYARLTAQVAARKPQVVVWPENAVSFLVDREPMLRPVLSAAAAAAQDGLILGAPRRDDADRSFNSAYLLDADATVRSVYDKQHLLPFAEYDPLPALGSEPLAGPLDFTRGPEAGPLDTPRLRLGTSICYEILFPHLIRRQVHDGAEVLVNLANDSWLDDGGGAAQMQHFSMVPFRAIETRRYVVRASSSGISGFFDPYGAPYATIPRAIAGVSVASVAALRGNTAYVRHGDLWMLLAGAGIVAGVSLGRRQGRPR